MPKVVGRAAALAAVVALGVAGCGKSDSGDGGPAATATASGSGYACTTPPKAPDEAQSQALPDKASAAGKTFVATVTTNCGDLVLELDGAKAPQTVASFQQLAKSYWKDSPCHRLTTSGIFVLQCGDPTGTGSGSPGYGFGIENAPASGQYPRGTLAMARTNDPNSNGGQFFIVYKDTELPTDGGGYSIFGKVVSGMPILDFVASRGTPSGDGPPAQPLSILKISVTEKKA
ncbi:peptidylprolyl isomerase [Metallococcus carri]|uniref:peptidylprolyl isomerase n=1 Tax=Metallococcus carri TaxID=1656884 RepID=UPI001A9E0B97|nr:peptidylprolyl isomerase [Metallococcus carri]